MKPFHEPTYECSAPNKAAELHGGVQLSPLPQHQVVVVVVGGGDVAATSIADAIRLFAGRLSPPTVI